MEKNNTETLQGENEKRGKRRPGPHPGPERQRTNIYLDPDLVDWGKEQSGGLSELVRQLIRERWNERPPAVLAGYSKRMKYDDCRWKLIDPKLEPPGQTWELEYDDNNDTWQFNKETKMFHVKEADKQGVRYYVGRFDWPFDENGVCYWLVADDENKSILGDPSSDTTPASE